MDKTVIISDLHLTDNIEDEYRWEFFDTEFKKVKGNRLIVLGDLTESKDRFSAKLTNRVVELFLSLKERFNEIIILTGNHDGYDVNQPFFKFLEIIEGVKFLTEPLIKFLEDSKCYFLPYSKDPYIEWARYDFDDYDYVFIHQDIQGAVYSNGHPAMGLKKNFFGKKAKVFSGHIHLHQKIDNILYIGSPYGIDFGDIFKGHYIIVDKDVENVRESINTPIKYSITITDICDLKKYKFDTIDKVKVKIELSKEALFEFENMRKKVFEYGIEKSINIIGVTLKVKQLEEKKEIQKIEKKSDKEIITSFGVVEQLSDNHIKIGLELVQ